MIAVESLLYKIDQKLNKVTALEHQLIPLENKILVLNEAQLRLIKLKLGTNNPGGLGLDAFKKRYEDLEILMERAAKHPLDLKEVDKNLNQWVADLRGLSPNYMFYIDSYILADKGECTGKVIFVNKDLIKHADIATLLMNSNYQPSFEYEETFCTISDLQLEIYTDGTFTPTKVYVSYIRYPKYIDYPGYVKLDGTNSVKQDCELPEYLEDEIVNIAVQELAMDTENNPAVQFSQARIASSE
jgi:hypothetical protein